MRRLFQLLLVSFCFCFFVNSCGKDGEGLFGKTKYGVDGKTPMPKAVDLGIKVNGKVIKWGSCNLGASRPEEMGDYYAWGETESKTDYDFSNYKFASFWQGPYSKYSCQSDNEEDNDYKTILDRGPYGDDVVSKKLGNKWRMPTAEEAYALYSQCKCEDAEVNGVRGVRLIGPNKNSLFLPFDNNFFYYQAHWWTSSLSSISGPFDNNAHTIDLYLQNGINIEVGSQERCCGLWVRPVYVEGGQSKSPSVKTLEATDVKAYSASLHAKIDFAGVDWASANSGFYWGTSKDDKGTYTPSERGRVENDDYLVKIMGLVPETQYWYKAFLEIDGKPYFGEVRTFTTEKSPTPAGAVDLGIVMTRDNGTTYRVYWAACNLCRNGFVSSPEVYGDYYAWGETEPKDNYSPSAYKFSTSMYGPFSKYNTEDNKTVLEIGPDGDDVASKLLGGNWRMPTDAEWTALRNNCEWTWSIQNGVTGDKATSKINGNSIFLPAAGDQQVGGPHGWESEGEYWSSSLITSYPCGAFAIRFVSWSIPYTPGRKETYRYYGCSIRPVYED